MATILVLHDGKPGHISQSLGLANTIAETHPAQVVMQRAQPRSGPAGRLARLLCRIPILGRNLFIRRILFKLDDEQTPEGHALAHYPIIPDLVVSMGGRVVACNAASARYFNCPNIVIGDRKSVPRDAFNANIRRKNDKNNIRVVGTGITFCKTSGTPATAAISQVPLSKTWCLLIGGKGSGYRYDHNDMRRLAAWLKQQTLDNDIEWVISTSRRTQAKHEQLLKALLEQDEVLKSKIKKALWVNSGDNGTIIPLMAASTKLFVTEDSLSMVNEAVAMNKSVYTLIPAQADIKGGHKKAMRYLCKQGLIQRIQLQAPQAIAELTPRISYSAHIKRILDQLSQLGAFDGIYRPKPESKPLQPSPSNA